MKFSEINELDWTNIGDWPGIAKAVLILLVCIAVVGAWYYFDTKEQYTELERAKSEERSLRIEFEDKQAKAVNLEAHRLQLAEMQTAFGELLRQLPDKSEVANLLIDVSQAGLASGLEFELFQPQPNVPKEFYVELPVSLRVIGDYHEFGEFISSLASMPRILTVHNVKIERIQNSQELLMAATAKTYYYTEEGALGEAAGGAQ